MLSPFPPFTVKIPKIFSVSFPIFLKIAATLLKELFTGLTTLPRYMFNNKTGGIPPRIGVQTLVKQEVMILGYDRRGSNKL
jgi:hypothetical protein